MREKHIGEHFAYLYQRAADDGTSRATDSSLLSGSYVLCIGRQIIGTAFLADVDITDCRKICHLFFNVRNMPGKLIRKIYRESKGWSQPSAKIYLARNSDYAWCHIVVQAKQLREIMPLVKNPDLSMVAEMIYYMQDNIKTRDVDWLAWEDPFIFNRDADELKREREQSLDETNKRLNYVLPMIETLTRFSKNGRK